MTSLNLNPSDEHDLFAFQDFLFSFSNIDPNELIELMNDATTWHPDHKEEMLVDALI